MKIIGCVLTTIEISLISVGWIFNISFLLKMRMLILFPLNYLQWPEFPASFPGHGNFNINPYFFRKFDYSKAAVLVRLPKFVVFHV